MPRRHLGIFFDLTIDERPGLMELLDTIREKLDTSHALSDDNIDIDDGPVAGHTVPYIHLPSIPKYHDEQPNPCWARAGYFARKRDVRTDNPIGFLTEST